MKRILQRVLPALATIVFTSNLSAENVLEEIVVTAQKRSESLQDVPIAVSAYSSEDILNQGINGTQALQALTPGLVYNNTGATAQPYLRGVGTRLAQNGLELSIATYADDRYISKSTSVLFELADIERIEVLKGPQGTLYGRNSTGGAIRIISKGVDDELNGSIKASYGNYGATTLSGTLNIPVSEDFGMRLTAITKERDGYADNVNPAGRDDWDDLDFQAFRAKFRWDMSDSATAKLTLDYWQRDDLAGVENVNITPANVPVSNNGAFGSALPQTMKRGKLASAIDDTNDGSEFSGQLRFDVAFDHFDFSSITTWNDFELDWLGDADGGSIKHLDAFVIEEASGYSQEFQFVSNNEGAFNWILGAYFFQDESDYELWVDISEAVPGLTFSQSAQTTETTSWAVFSQLKWELSDDLNLTIGARFTEDEKEVEAVASELPFLVLPVLGALAPIELDDSWSEFTPSVTLDYYMSEDVMLYAGYSRGFKSGGYNYPVVTTLPPEQSGLDPEVLDMFEIGMKGEFMNSTVRANASLYYYDYKDLQVTRAAGDGAGAAVTTENAADATITGLDLDVLWLASDAMTITAGLNILDTEYEDYQASARVYSTAGPSSIGFDASGENMLRAPEFSAFLAAEYVISLDGGELPIYISYSYKDDYDFDFVFDSFSDGLTQEAYGLLNARVSYTPDNGAWSLGIFGSNLTDEDYLDDAVGNPPGIRVNFGVPRIYGVDFTYNF